MSGRLFLPRELFDQEVEDELIWYMAGTADPHEGSRNALLWNALFTIKALRLLIRERTMMYHEQCVKAGIYTHSIDFRACDVRPCREARETIWA